MECDSDLTCINNCLGRTYFIILNLMLMKIFPRIVNAYYESVPSSLGKILIRATAVISKYVFYI